MPKLVSEWTPDEWLDRVLELERENVALRKDNYHLSVGLGFGRADKRIEELEQENAELEAARDRSHKRYQEANYRANRLAQENAELRERMAAITETLDRIQPMIGDMIAESWEFVERGGGGDE